MKNKTLKLLFYSLISLFLIIYSLPLTLLVSAQDMPSKEVVAAQITEQATAQTNTIQPTSAPAATTQVANTGDTTTTNTNSTSNTQTQVNNTNTTDVNQTVN